MLKFTNAKAAANARTLGQKTFRVPGLGLQERFIVWGGVNGAVMAMVLLGMSCYFIYDLASAKLFDGLTFSPLRLELEGGGALACGVVGLFLMSLHRRWRDLAVFLQGGVPLRDAQERMGRLDRQGIDDGLNDVARDFLRDHSAEVEAWRDDLKTFLDGQFVGNPQVAARLNFTPETVQALLEDRVAITRAMLSGAPMLMQIGRLLRWTGVASELKR